MKAKRGRPALPPENVRSKVVGVRLTEGEFRRLERAAKKEGAASVSEWARDVLERRVARMLKR